MIFSLSYDKKSLKIMRILTGEKYIRNLDYEEKNINVSNRNIVNDTNYDQGFFV